jgi:hypothetical protein
VGRRAPEPLLVPNALKVGRLRRRQRLGGSRVILLAPDVLYRSQSTGDFIFFWNALIECAG